MDGESVHAPSKEQAKVQADILLDMQRVREMKKDMVVMKEVSTKGLEEMKEMSNILILKWNKVFEMKDLRGRQFTKSSPR